VKDLPNLITLGRFLIAPIVMLLLLTDQYWAGLLTAFFIALAGLSDFMDGYLARHWKVESDVGKLLDPIADKVLVVTSLVMLVGLGRLHPILVVIIVSREIMITGLRAIAAVKKLVIPAATSGKFKTTFQFLAIGSLAIHESWGPINGHLLGLLFIYISIGFSIYSAIEYVRLFLSEINLKL